MEQDFKNQFYFRNAPRNDKVFSNTVALSDIFK